MKELCDNFKIKHHNSSPYRPKMNGTVEVANKNIKKIIQKMVVTYKDCKDLKEKVDYYMEHPKEAEKLAERGHQLVLEKHTFAKRMDKLVQDLSGL